MISLTDRPGAGPRGGVPFLIKLASHCGKNALQKSSTAQKVSTSRSNMLTSHDMIGSAQFLESLIHKALMPPIPVIGVMGIYIPSPPAALAPGLVDCAERFTHPNQR